MFYEKALVKEGLAVVEAWLHRNPDILSEILGRQGTSTSLPPHFPKSL